jgi:alpha-ketoglutarate-dependent taurine dioxygenase
VTPIPYEPLSEDFGAVVSRQDGEDLFDLDVPALIDLFKKRGLVLFRGYGGGIAEMERFSGLLTSDWMPYEGGAHERRVLNPEGDGTIYSVNFYLGRKVQVMFELPVHSDMSYIKHHPVFLFFYCVQPAKSGGETQVVDGLRVYRSLSEGTRRLFAARRIKYIRTYKEGDWQVRFGTADLDRVRRFCAKNELALTIEEQEGGAHLLRTEYLASATPLGRYIGERVFCNSIMPVLKTEESGLDISLVRLEDGAPIPPDVVAELKEVTTRLRLLPRLEKTEMLWVDNTRVLHGRMTFDDPARDVAIRMAGSTTW